MRKIRMIAAVAAALVVSLAIGVTNVFAAENTAIKHVKVTDTANAMLILNNPVGGDYAINNETEADVTFLTETNAFAFGVVPTNVKEDYATENLSANSGGYANRIRSEMWFDGTKYQMATKQGGVWKEGADLAIQSALNGRMTFKFVFDPYGQISVKVKIPSSNTLMGDITKDEWIDFVAKSQWYPYIYYENSNYSGGNNGGYIFLEFNNVIYHSIKTTHLQFSSMADFSEDFSDPATFGTKFVTNEDFDNGVAAGKIEIPKAEEEVKPVSSGETGRLRVNGVTDAKIIVNSAIGGGKGNNSTVETETYFTVPTKDLTFGAARSVDAEEVEKNENYDYFRYYVENGVSKIACFKAGQWSGGISGETADAYGQYVKDVEFYGEVKFKTVIGAYGTSETFFFVPSSNVLADESIARDQWLGLFKDASGLFGIYGKSAQYGQDLTGYIFFAADNVEYISVSITAGQYSEIDPFSFNFGMPLKFDESFVLNAAAKKGVEDGKILKAEMKNKVEIDLSGMERYFYSMETIVFNPTASDLIGSELTVSMRVYDGETEITDGVNGLSFTPTKTGVYTVKIAATAGDGANAEKSVEIYVSDLKKQADISAKFDGDKDKFDSENVTVSGGKGVFAANSAFGVKNRARNFILMSRITEIDEEADDFTVYFGKMFDGDEPYFVTFTKGKTTVKIKDENGVVEADAGVDIFSVEKGDGIVVRIEKTGDEIAVALKYGDLPLESLSVPVMTKKLSFEKEGKVGVSSVSGGITTDKFIFINYSTYDEIEDDEVPPEKLGKPTLKLSGNTVNWKKINNAVSYEVTVNGVKHTVKNESFVINGEEYGDYVVTVKAIGDGTVFLDGDAATITYTKTEPTSEPTSEKESGGSSGGGCFGSIGGGFILLTLAIVAAMFTLVKKNKKA